MRKFRKMAPQPPQALSLQQELDATASELGTVIGQRDQLHKENELLTKKLGLLEENLQFEIAFREQMEETYEEAQKISDVARQKQQHAGDQLISAKRQNHKILDYVQDSRVVHDSQVKRLLSDLAAKDKKFNELKLQYYNELDELRWQCYSEKSRADDMVADLDAKDKELKELRLQHDSQKSRADNIKSE